MTINTEELAELLQARFAAPDDYRDTAADWMPALLAEIEWLRALLTEARVGLALDGWPERRDILARIDAALGGEA